MTFVERKTRSYLPLNSTVWDIVGTQKIYPDLLKHCLSVLIPLYADYSITHWNSLIPNPKDIFQLSFLNLKYYVRYLNRSFTKGMFETYVTDECLWYYLMLLCTTVVQTAVWLCFPAPSNELLAPCWSGLIIYLCLWLADDSDALRGWWSYFTRNPFALSRTVPQSL